MVKIEDRIEKLEARWPAGGGSGGDGGDGDERRDRLVRRYQPGMQERRSERHAHWLKTAPVEHLENRLRRLDRLEATQPARFRARAEALLREGSEAVSILGPEEWVAKLLRYAGIGNGGGRREIVVELLRRNDVGDVTGQAEHIITVVRKNTDGPPMAELIIEAVAAGGQVPTVH